MKLSIFVQVLEFQQTMTITLGRLFQCSIKTESERFIFGALTLLPWSLETNVVIFFSHGNPRNRNEVLAF